MNSYYRVYAEIDLGGLTHNIGEMRKQLKSGTQIMAIIKADGYGAGSVPIARTLIEGGVDRLGVAMLEEGMILRKCGIDEPILILGYTPEHQYGYLVQYEITPSVFSCKMAEALSRTAVSLNKIAKIHIKLDTGMSRIGFLPNQESLEEIVKISKLPNIFIEGIFSHFARADEGVMDYPNQQMEVFDKFVEQLEQRGVHIPTKHIGNSAAIIDVNLDKYNLARAGIAIYGLYPSEEVNKKAVDLQPVLSLKSHIIYIKEVAEGTAVSYGGTYVTDKKTRIATIPVGYGDGYPRLLSNKGRVLINGQYAPIIGRICMDQFMVDVTDLKEINEGDTVTLIGKDKDNQITVEEIANLVGTINYEIVCNLGKRIPRVYIQNEKIIRTIDYFE